MKMNKMIWVATALSLVVTSCKNDDEGDLIPPPSLNKALCINEVYSSNPDWVELYNSTEKDIDLSGYSLHDDKGIAEAYSLPAGTIIKAKSHLVLEAFAFGLSSSNGDVVKLFNAKNVLVDEVIIPAIESGKSYGRSTDGSAEWKKWDVPTKGKENTPPAMGTLKDKIVINEVYTFSNQSTVEDLDWIELYNTTDAEIDLSGLLLWESGGKEECWAIPSGKKIAPKSRLLIECDKYALHADPINYPAWGLSKGPDEYVVLADANYTLIDSIKCPSLNENESYGRKTDGAAQWQIFAQYTKGTTNTGAGRTEHSNTIGLYINEVYTDNSTKTGITSWDATVDFIELYNSTSLPLDISGWEIYDDTADDSKKYVVPAGTVVPAKGYLVYEVFKENLNGPQFGLGVGGDWVFIYNKPGRQEANLVDKIEIPGLAKDATPQQRDMGYTYGRFTDGASSLTFFKQASKGASNNGKEIVVFE